jgi:hypothetical protein
MVHVLFIIPASYSPGLCPGFDCRARKIYPQNVFVLFLYCTIFYTRPIAFHIRFITINYFGVEVEQAVLPKKKTNRPEYYFCRDIL